MLAYLIYLIKAVGFTPTWEGFSRQFAVCFCGQQQTHATKAGLLAQLVLLLCFSSSSRTIISTINGEEIKRSKIRPLSGIY